MKDLLMSYYQQRMQRCTRDYLYDILGFHLTPVIHAAKPSALLSLTNIIRKDLLETWDYEKRKLDLWKLVTFQELKTNENRRSILFYQVEKLKHVFQVPENQNFLKSIDGRYGVGVYQNIQVLKQRINGIQFPHEVGIFLGIPVHDVVSFMTTPQNTPLITGYWKVYHEPDQAQQLFDQYDKAKREFMEYLLRGRAPQEYFELRA